LEGPGPIATTILSGERVTMDRPRKRLLVERLADRYKVFCTYAAVVAAFTIALMILSTTMDATSRYLLNSPIPGVFELNEVLLVVCVYLGLAWTQIERGHIRVTAFLMRLSDETETKFIIFAWVVTFIFIFILAYQSAIGAWESFQIREFRWGSVQMPIWWAKALVPIGCWMMNVQLIFDIWKDIEFLRGRLPKQRA
jgi:TRAP-type C4-dicarboxylate transport system permease small subunit